MTKISLQDKVVIVTGAGRGLGRAYALELAQYGARVVVNDVGAGIDGHGASPAVAQDVADLIRSRGGQAIADATDIRGEAECKELVHKALSEFGRLDVVINNAGIGYEIPFEQTTLADFEHFWRIHVGGHINVTRAAWPVMTQQGGGKIIMTCSGAGLFGQRNLATYAAAKGAIHGLMRTLAIEGRDHGIQVNCVSPGGVTRMHETAFGDPQVIAMLKAAMPAELAAPGIVWLASDDCRLTGQNFALWAGRFAKVVIASGRGLVDRQLTPEKISAGIELAMSPDDAYEPEEGVTDVSYWLAAMGVVGGERDR